MPPVRNSISWPVSGKRRLPRPPLLRGTVGSAEPLRAVGTNVGALHMLTRHGLSDSGQMGHLRLYVKRTESPGWVDLIGGAGIEVPADGLVDKTVLHGAPKAHTRDSCLDDELYGFICFYLEYFKGFAAGGRCATSLPSPHGGREMRI